MKLIKKKDKRTNLEREIDHLVASLEYIDVFSEEYLKQVELIERLNKLKVDKKPKISPETVAIVGGAILQTVMILYREELGHVITSKAMQLVLRGRV